MIESNIDAGGTRTFVATLQQDEFAQITIHQIGMDLVTYIHDPNQEVIHKADWRWSGTETVSWIARSAGEHRIVVSARRVNGAPGKFTLTLSGIRPRTGADSEWSDAERALTEIKEAVDGKTTYTKLEDSIGRALTLWQELEYGAGVAQTLNVRGFLQNASGQHEAALASYEQALALRAGKDEAGEAETLHNMAAVESALGQKLKARDLYEQALRLRKKAGDLDGTAFTLSNLGAAHLSLGQVDGAIQVLEEAVAANKLVAHSTGETQARINLGATYAAVGEPESALEQLHAALDIAKRENDLPGQAYALANLGKIYVDFADYQRGLLMYNRAITLMRALDDKRGEAMILANTGVCYRLDQNPKLALQYLDRAITFFRQIRDRFTEGQILQRISHAYLSLGDFDQAIHYNTDALRIAQSLADIRGEAGALRQFGEIEHGTRNFTDAIEHLHQSRTLYERMRQKDGEADALLALSRVYLDSGNTAAARRSIEEGLQIIESQRSKAASSRLRGSYFASKRAFYDFYIGLLMALDREQPDRGYATAALEASERGRSRLLLDTIPLSRINPGEAVDPALAARKRLLHREINRLALQIQGGTLNEKATGEVNGRLESLLSELDDVQSQILKRDPAYGELISPSLLRVSAVQGQLDGETVLLEYHLGEDRSFLWMVTRTEVTAFADLPPRSEIEQLVRVLYESLTARSRVVKGESVAQKRARLAAAAASFQRTSAVLSKKLLGAVGDALSDKRVAIVADGALQFLPFGALPAPGDVNGRPLIARHEVVNLPSASVLAALRHAIGERQRPKRTVAVIADPVFSPDDPRVDVRAPTDTSDNGRPSTGQDSELRGDTDFHRLIYSRQEARAILALAPANSSKAVLDFDANRSAAMDPELASYRIAHFSTHGVVDSVHPSLSALVLSLVDEAGQDQDGFLRLHQIYNLRLPVDLVVLSACQTAMGKEIHGEGLLSLMRGFMYAGAPRLVATLWQVDDEATAELMKSFYRGVLGKSRLSPAAALRRAQIGMLSDPRWRDPYYWAAFVSFGDWQ